MMFNFLFYFYFSYLNHLKLTKMKNLTFYGTDASNEISLLEHGLLVSNEEHEDGSGTHFVIYSTCGLFGSSHISEKEINGYLQGKEFLDEEEIKSFLSFVGMKKDKWLQMNIANKLYDLIQYYGADTILGSDYFPVSLETLKEYHNLGF